MAASADQIEPRSMDNSFFYAQWHSKLKYDLHLVFDHPRAAVLYNSYSTHAIATII